MGPCYIFVATMGRLEVVFVTVSVLFQAAWGSGLNNVGVFGGDEIDIIYAPYMALLETNQDVPCGGIIVDENFILTTSTCCEQGVWNNPIWRARVGTNGTQGSGGYIKIKNAVKYPVSDLKPNICLLQLARGLSLNRQVAKIPMDDGSAILAEGTPVSFTAFGVKSKDDITFARVLRRATLPIDGSDWCKRDTVRMGGKIFCAGDHEKNACYGDNGGALTYNGALIGVLSTPPRDCFSYASRFSRISYYRSWILQIIKDRV